MTRVCIIGEGQTEVEFVNRCLAPYLTTRNLLAYGTLLNTGSKRQSGGNVTVERLAEAISRHYGQADRVTTLVDFYGFKDKGARTRAQLETDIRSAVAARKKEYDPRFVLPYVQMHEFEALLFTNPSCFCIVVDGWSEDVKAALMKVASRFQNPEDINDSPETAPSKRLERIFPKGTYSKREHGPLIAESIGIDAIRAKCRAFDEWVGKIQDWGSAA